VVEEHRGGGKGRAWKGRRREVPARRGAMGQGGRGLALLDGERTRVESEWGEKCGIGGSWDREGVREW